MALKTTLFDPAEHIRTPEGQADLLNDALESGHSGYIASAIGIIARARGMTEVARGAGVTREALYKALSSKGDPRLSTLTGTLKTLGFRLSARRIAADAPNAKAGPARKPRRTPKAGRRASAA
jgi:probable addiction module antidote protein